MAVGLPLKTTYADGDVYSASDVNDTNGTINLFQTSTLSRSAGKNAVINGGMDVWQRGTSFALALNVPTYTADRWFNARSATGQTVSRQVTGDTTNLPNIQYCARVQRDNGNTSTAPIRLNQPMETVNTIPMVGQVVTLSFYARRGANFSSASNVLGAYLITGTGTDQNALTGGYTGQANLGLITPTLTTTWQRFTTTATVGTSVTEISANFEYTPVGTAGAADFFEITGVQLELGSYATTFSRAGGTIQGELAACQRYYYRSQTNSAYDTYGAGFGRTSTTAWIQVKNPITMRAIPSSVDYANLKLSDGGAANTITSLAINSGLGSTTDIAFFTATVSSGISVNRPYFLMNDGSTSAYVGFSAEL